MTNISSAILIFKYLPTTPSISLIRIILASMIVEAGIIKTAMDHVKKIVLFLTASNFKIQGPRYNLTTDKETRFSLLQKSNWEK